MNDACTKWKDQHNIDFSLYGPPLESTTYKFAKCLQKRFGLVPGITDRNYITNSYHVHVTEQIDAFTKLKFESDFQKLSPGGAISYVEVPNMQDNLEAVIKVMQFIYENIMYAELNTKSDYCQVCGYDGDLLQPALLPPALRSQRRDSFPAADWPGAAGGGILPRPSLPLL